MVTTTVRRYKAGVLINTTKIEGLDYRNNVLDCLEAWRRWGYVVEVTFSRLGRAREVSFSPPDFDTYETYSFT